jgi:hypothetical protein
VDSFRIFEIVFVRLQNPSDSKFDKMTDSTRDAETDERFTVLLSALQWQYWTGKVRYITDNGYITVPDHHRHENFRHQGSGEPRLGRASS